tara:strand:+ start:358 stop:747 length:390 start_codon:yes stop_codon:yes gene_type:complete
MKIKLLGLTLRVECIVISMLIGVIIGYHLISGCTCNEGMSTMDYTMNNGVHNNQYEHKYNQFEVNQNASLSPKVPMNEGQLFMWANNEFNAKCCETSNVSGNSGCACITQEQADFLNSRGGNRASNSEY